MIPPGARIPGDRPAAGAIPFVLLATLAWLAAGCAREDAATPATGPASVAAVDGAGGGSGADGSGLTLTARLRKVIEELLCGGSSDETETAAEAATRSG